MILSKLFSQYKNNWIKSKESELKEEFEKSLKSLKEKHAIEFSQYQRDCDETMLIASDNFKKESEKFKSEMAALGNLRKEIELEIIEIKENRNKYLDKIESDFNKKVFEIKDGEKELSNRKTMLEYEKMRMNAEEDNLKHLEKLVEQKRIDLERVREELKLQIRITEAKSSPEQVWTTAFESGFSKAWAMMVPVITDGLEKQKEMIRNKAIEETRKRLEPFVKPNGR